MTAQIPDTIVVDATPHVLAAVDGAEPLFEPTGHGIVPGPFHTACYRGFVCSFTVDDGRLLLWELTLGPHATVAGRPVSGGTEIFGTPLAEDTDDGSFTVAPLRVDVPFTGRLLAGRGLIEDLHVNMGYAPGWKYEHVVELVLDRGRLAGRRDRSPEVAAIRRAILAGTLPDPDGERGGKGWVTRTFSLAFERTFPLGTR
ncbi:hypothetical protein [Nonomuraea antimicrobica]|uniref:hypothetical protein n=1 Tax=Nonomuraea antimicrobica TaxID=561173 RepID=UPI0031ECDA5C